MTPENLALYDLLIGLAGTDPATLYDDDSGMGNGHVSALIESWQAAGFPGVEQGTPIPDDFDDLCMIEVAPPYRGSRGRFWMPKGHGYTNDPKQAGLFTADEARSIVRDVSKTRAILAVS